MIEDRKPHHRRRNLLRANTAAALIVVAGIGNCCFDAVSASSSSTILRSTTSSPIYSSGSGSASPQRNNDGALRKVTQFLHHRCGTISNNSNNNNVEPAVWVYTGTLMDPLTGQRIANVEGLELVQLLASTTSSSTEALGSSKSNNNNSNNNIDKDHHTALARFRRCCGDLQIAKAVDGVHDDDVTNEPCPIFCGTLLSRKLFCYTETKAATASSSSSRLLHQLRKRPGGPVTHIPVEQAVTVYDSAVSVLVPTTGPSTSLSSSSSTADGNSNNNDNNNWLMHTEWPNGKSIWGLAQHRPVDLWNAETTPTPTITVAPQSSFSLLFRRRRQTVEVDADRAAAAAVEFTVYSRPKAKLQCLQPQDVQQLLLLLRRKQVAMHASPNRNNDDDDDEPSVAPRRAAWIQFGSSSAEQQQSKYGARESYSFPPNDETTNSKNKNNNNNKHQLVRYTRYGEAPVWYGPGRQCQLELTGRKLRLDKTIHNIGDGDDDAWNDADWDEIRRHVPTAMATIQQHVPNFWKFGPTTTRRVGGDVGVDSTIHDVDGTAVGDWVNRNFWKHPVAMNLPSSSRGDSGPVPSFHQAWQAVHQIHATGRRVMGMVRAATSISLGGGGG